MLFVYLLDQYQNFRMPANKNYINNAKKRKRKERFLTCSA